LKKKSALSVSGGIEKPGPLNQEALKKLRDARKDPQSVAQILEGIRAGDATVLGRAITLVESSLPEHQEKAQDLIAACLPFSGKAFRLGITGVPGAGKSTFIEALGKYITDRGKKLAVLAIDPSSDRSKGSILGDKTRMEELAVRTEVFVRPSPSGGTLGGVARKTRETMILCEAAGFDTLFVETVGVGQSETAVHGMVDFFLLLMLAGAGDELQGIKRGIMELADGIVINKADGTNIEKVRRAQGEYTNALHLFPPAPSGWTPRVSICSSLYQTGIAEIWEMISEFRKHTAGNGYHLLRRKEQSRYWMYETLREGILNRVFQDPDVRKDLDFFEKEISEGRMTSFMAASKILEKYRPS
jgi:LAO/AO transport system kinase